jgi:hypothetical protein
MATKSNLTKLIEKYLNLEEDSQDFFDVYAYTISYLTNGITAFVYQKSIKPYIETSISAKSFRLLLLKNKFNSLSVKLFLLELSKPKKVASIQQAVEVSAQYGLSKRDVLNCYYTWRNSSRFRARLKRAIKSVSGKNTSEHGIEKEFIEDVYPSVIKYVKFLTYKKLRFLVKANNLDFVDFHNDILIKTLQAYYKLVPTEKSLEYVINYLKRVAHNHVINLISLNTTKKRGRMVCTGINKNNERSFSLLAVSENQIRMADDSGEENSFSIQNQGSDSFTEKVINEICVTAILDKYKLRPKKYRLLLILSGIVDEQFTQWLRKNKYCSAKEDNSELQDRLDPHDFRKLLSLFLNVDENKVNVFLLGLSNSLTTTESSYETNTAQKKRIGV